MVERVCEAYAAATGTLREVFSSRDDLPDLSTIYQWEQDIPGFSERLNRARQIRAHHMAQEAIEIADGTAYDTITATARDGTEYTKPDHEWINRSRLRVETRLRLAKALNQRTYGDKSEQSGSLEIVYRIHVGSKP